MVEVVEPEVGSELVLVLAKQKVLKGEWGWRNEPADLAEVWSLLAHLEHEPLVEEVALLYVRVCECLLWIILVDEVLNNSTGFPELKVGVWVVHH